MLQRACPPDWDPGCRIALHNMALCAVAGSHGGLVIVQFPLARATRIISSGRFRLRRAQLRQIGRPSTYPPGKLPFHGAAATGQFRRAFALAADADAHQVSPRVCYSVRRFLATSLAKIFRFGERYAFQFRLDAYNTFNHVNWGSPSGNWSAATFGNITSAGPMRTFELTGRLTF